MKKLIYLDNAATTKTAPEVVEAMLPYFTEYYGNPSSVYEFAGKSKQAVDAARKTIADSLGAKPEEIYFTAGGSESDNWALKATAEAYASKENTSSQARSSITLSFIPASIWRNAVLRSPTWMWMRTVL
ncbi:MAG: aminotransferase class V-fold PLP-dependent enzyme [Lachnospiraceae bacterium]